MKTMKATHVLACALLVGACDASSAENASNTDDAAVAQAAETVDSVVITEWDVPWPTTRPRDPDVAPDGRVWFVGQAGNYVAVLDPRDASFRRFELAADVLPHNLIVADDGAIWYAGNNAAHIGRMDPASGAVHVIDMPDPAARDPHTLVFGADGDIWFTVQQGAFVGRLDPESERVDLIRMPAGSRPYGVVADSGGGAWVVLFGTNRIVRVAPDLTTRAYDLPAADARPRRLARASDGGVWFVDHARGRLGRLDPASGAVREWAAPGGERARPYAMTIDDRDRLWFVETGSQPNRFVGFDPVSQTFIANTAVPSGGVVVRHMVFHEPTRTVWFGTDRNTIGRAELP